ncbi:SMC-Scp complex subunit ScpB, partial [Rhizobium brockwellii]
MIDLKSEEHFEDNVEERGRDVQAEIEAERIAEALVFASSQPVSEGFLAERLPEKTDVHAIMLR